ncbi:MAG: phage tail tape measure protein, partial [Candidatus Lokiarchaeota archaeon]|nr:phage tail tape measure protein [Candidatus Lokiarchaeota archaeon]
IYDAEQGLATASDALDALGVSSEELEGKSPEQQFKILSSALADVDDASRKAALAQDIFGRAGTGMLPMLAEGSEGIAAMRKEAQELGIVFDQEAADSAAKFNDDMDRLKKSFTGVFQELGNKLIPIFVDDLIPAIKDTLVPMIQDFAEKVGNLVQWFADLNPVAQKVILAVIG